MTLPQANTNDNRHYRNSVHILPVLIDEYGPFASFELTTYLANRSHNWTASLQPLPVYHQQYDDEIFAAINSRRLFWSFASFCYSCFDLCNLTMVMFVQQASLVCFLPSFVSLVKAACEAIHLCMAIHPAIIHTMISPLEDNIKASHRVNR